MKELDFDELDKAVNSLVSQDAADRSPVGADKEGKIETPATRAPAETEPPKKSAASSARPAAPTPVVTPGHRSGRLGVKGPSAGPSRGNFIDIVSKPKPAAPPKVLSRTAPVIQPVSSKESLQASQQTESPVVESAQSEPGMATATDMEAEKPELTQTHAEKTIIPPKPKEAISPKQEPAKQEEKWPDPLDFEKPEKSEEKEKEEEPNSAITEKTSLPPEGNEPKASSPFIPGAKVEKRPLGAYTPTEPPQPKPPAEAPQSEEPDTAKINAPTVVPDELKPDVLAVESEEVATAKPEAEEEAAPKESPDSDKPPKQPAAEQVRESAMMSIPQQYKTTHKPVDDSTRSVFDTKEYHPPLLEETAHAAHRGGSTWGRLLITVLILAVLAAGGYFAFMYFVQNL